MSDRFKDAIETVYVQACIDFRKAAVDGNQVRADLFMALTKALDLAYQLEVESIGLTAERRNASKNKDRTDQ